MKLNPKAIGEITEGVILAALLKAGKVVLLPFGNNQRYDLLVDESGVFKRIQCKTAKLSKDNDAITFNASSSAGGKGKRSYRGEIELFGVYCPQLNTIYFVPVDSVRDKGSISLRLRAKKCAYLGKMLFATDFEFKGELP